MTVNFCFPTAGSGQSCAVGATAFASERYFFCSLCSSVLSTFLIRRPLTTLRSRVRVNICQILKQSPRLGLFFSPFPPPRSPLMSASCVGATKVSHPFLHFLLPGIQSLFQLYWGGGGVCPSASSQRHKQPFALSFTFTAAGNLEIPH